MGGSTNTASVLYYMHKLLTNWLEKRGIRSPEELDNTPMPDGSPTERQTFEEYKKILSKEHLSVEDIKVFCQNQISIIEAKWANYEFDKKADLIPYHTVYKAIISAIDGQQASREAAERQLEQLIK